MSDLGVAAWDAAWIDAILAAYRQRRAGGRNLRRVIKWLGNGWTDLLGTEGKPGEQAACLGLLPVSTQFLPHKETHQARMLLPDGEKVEGYEIHTGETDAREGTASFGEIIERNGKKVSIPDGATLGGGKAWGTYLHGLFDNDRFRHRWLRRLGWSGQVVATTELRNREYDRLADAVGASVDWTAVEALI